MTYSFLFSACSGMETPGVLWYWVQRCPRFQSAVSKSLWPLPSVTLLYFPRSILVIVLVTDPLARPMACLSFWSSVCSWSPASSEGSTSGRGSILRLGFAPRLGSASSCLSFGSGLPSKSLSSSAGGMWSALCWCPGIESVSAFLAWSSSCSLVPAFGGPASGLSVPRSDPKSSMSISGFALCLGSFLGLPFLRLLLGTSRLSAVLSFLKCGDLFSCLASASESSCCVSQFSSGPVCNELMSVVFPSGSEVSYPFSESVVSSSSLGGNIVKASPP